MLCGSGVVVPLGFISNAKIFGEEEIQAKAATGTCVEAAATWDPIQPE